MSSGSGSASSGGGRGQQQRVAQLDLGLGLVGGLAIDRGRPRQYQVLDAVAREGRQRLGEHGIEPAAGQLGIDRDLEFLVLASEYPA